MTLVPIPLSAAAIKEAAAFFERFGGIARFVESILDVPSEFLRHWHQDNLIRWYDKLQEESETRKAEGKKPIPPSLLMPALQKIAMEDDDDILGMWATLFANFQDPQRQLEPNKIFVHMLSEMQPLDVKLLHHIVTVLPTTQQLMSKAHIVSIGIVFVTPEQLADKFEAARASVLLSIHNLGRLGCLLGSPPESRSYLLGDEAPPPSIPQVPSIITEDGCFYLSSLGIALVDACRSAGGSS